MIYEQGSNNLRVPLRRDFNSLRQYASYHMLVLTQTGSSMVWRGVGSRSITSTGGLSHQVVPGLCLQSTKGNEILLAMRLHTPVEISTKKTFLQILAPPKMVPSALQARRVTQWSDIIVAASPDWGKRLKYTALRVRYFSPSCHLLAPVLSRVSHSVHPLGKCHEQDDLAALGCSRVTHTQRGFQARLPCSNRFRHIMSCCKPADAIPWHPTGAGEEVYF